MDHQHAQQESPDFAAQLTQTVQALGYDLFHPVTPLNPTDRLWLVHIVLGAHQPERITSRLNGAGVAVQYASTSLQYREGAGYRIVYEGVVRRG